MSPFELFADGPLTTTTHLLTRVTLLLMAAWMSHIMLRQQHPGWRILTWRVTTIGLICVGLQSFNSPYFTVEILPAIPTTIDRRETAVTAIRPGSSDVRDTRKSLPTAADHSTLHFHDSMSRQSLANGSSGEVPASSRAATTRTMNHLSFAILSPLTWAFLIWCIGTMFGIFRLLVGIVYVSRIRRISTEVPDWVDAELARVETDGAHAQRVQVLQTDVITTPCSVGLLQKSILLPSNMCDEAHASEIRAVLAHEVAHFTAHDHPWNFALHVLSVFFWFHPLAWRIRLAHADACDERCDAIAARCLQDVEQYGRLLARVALQGTRRTPMTALPMARARDIAGRIESIRRGVGAHELPKWKTRTAAIVSAVLLVSLAAIGVGRSAAQPTAESQPVADKKGTDIAISAARSQIEPVPLEFSAPKLIAVWPAAGAEGVDPSTELHLRFDRPIDPMSFDLEWSQGGYLECGRIHYLKDKNEMVVPIRLEADRQQKIVINSNNRGFHNVGFLSTDGLPANSSEWQFRTKANRFPENERKPRVITIDPPSGTKIGRVTFVRIQFDQAMDPVVFDLPNRQAVSREGIEFNTGVSYNAEHNEFVFPVALPSNWTGQVTFAGLKSRNGVEADPITLTYSTQDDVFNEIDVDRLKLPASLARLRNVVEKAQRARRDLQSVSETVRTVSFGGRGIRERSFSELEGNSSRFKMQKQRQFYGDVSQIMGIPFQIGSDGVDCWFFSHRPNGDGASVPTLITCKYGDIPDKSVLIVEPFDFDIARLDEVVKQRHLEYVGVDKFNDSDCHLVRSLNVHEFGGDGRILLLIDTWWIDSKTFRPVQLAMDTFNGRTVNRFLYHSINQQLPLAEFQPTISGDTTRRGPDPLGEGYDTRFLKISDGTNGRMSARWGKTGTNGTYSSGLN